MKIYYHIYTHTHIYTYIYIYTYILSKSVINIVNLLLKFRFDLFKDYLWNIKFRMKEYS